MQHLQQRKKAAPINRLGVADLVADFAATATARPPGAWREADHGRKTALGQRLSTITACYLSLSGGRRDKADPPVRPLARA